VSGATAGGRRALHVLVGPTASGKSAVAQFIAEQTGAAVLSADSMLIYRGMDIGTAKPGRAERGRVLYLGLDLADPCEMFSVWQYRQAVVAQLAGVPAERGIVVAGGSGLYIRALTDGLDGAGAQNRDERDGWDSLFAAQGVEGLQAALRERAPGALDALADARNPRRLIRALERCTAAGGGSVGTRRQWDGPSAAPVLAGLRLEPAVLGERIERRVEAMYAAGLLDEVANLLASGMVLSRTARQAIGYAEAMAVLEGRCSRGEAMARTAARTRQLAKRQRTWFRHQARVEWVDVGASDPVASVARQVQQIWRTYGSAELA